MADVKRKCPLCGRRVWVLETGYGWVWEIHIDLDGQQCGASGQKANRPN